MFTHKGLFFKMCFVENFIKWNNYYFVLYILLTFICIIDVLPLKCIFWLAFNYQRKYKNFEFNSSFIRRTPAVQGLFTEMRFCFYLQFCWSRASNRSMTYLIESNKDTPKILLGTLTGYSQYNVDCDIWKISKRTWKSKRCSKYRIRKDESLNDTH